MPADPPLPQGSRGQTTDLAAPAPTTPRKNGAELSTLIDSFGQQWQLGLPVRDRNWSPIKGTNALSDKVYDQLKRFYWQGDFYTAIRRFILAVQSRRLSLADTLSARNARLNLLQEIVREIDEERGRSTGSRAGTPGNQGRTLRPGLSVVTSDESCELQCCLYDARAGRERRIIFANLVMHCLFSCLMWNRSLFDRIRISFLLV